MLTGEDSRQTVQMEQHIACTCGCTVQQQDCTELQVSEIAKNLYIESNIDYNYCMKWM